ncbi:hypothetical protein IE989_25490 [Klebsiella pneumoniae]|nr:hypothetical protein [Klebsiella pneumoniae]
MLLLSRADLDEGDDLTLDRGSPAGAGAYGSPAHQPPRSSSTTAICSSPPVKPSAGALLLALFYYGAFRASAAGATFFPAADPRKT